MNCRQDTHINYILFIHLPLHEKNQIAASSHIDSLWYQQRGGFTLSKQNTTLHKYFLVSVSSIFLLFVILLGTSREWIRTLETKYTFAREFSHWYLFYIPTLCYTHSPKFCSHLCSFLVLSQTIKCSQYVPKCYLL